MIDFYNAFISYKHAPLDSKVAEDVQRRLERFNIPHSIRKKTGKKRIERVFRDKDELPITSDLTDTISNALSKAEYLIVICSPRTKESIWVDREIDFFLKNHDMNRILTVLAEGEPYEVIPERILKVEKEVTDYNGYTHTVTTEIEPLSCDYRMPFSRAHKEEIPRLAAALIGCSYDELVRRQRAYRTKQIIAISAVVATAALIFGGYMLKSKMEVDAAYRQSMIDQSRYLAIQSDMLLEEDHRVDALHIALASLPEDLNDTDAVTSESLSSLAAATNAYVGMAGSNVGQVWNYMTSGPVVSVAVNEDGTRMAAIDTLGGIMVWNTENHDLLFSLSNIYALNGQIKFVDGDKLLVFSNENIAAYDSDTGDMIWEIDADSSGDELGLFTTTDIESVSDGEIMICRASRSLLFIDTDSGEINEEYDVSLQIEGVNASYSHIQLSPDKTKVGMVIYNGFDSSYVAVYDLATKSFKQSEELGLYVSDMTWCDDDKLVIAAYDFDAAESNIFSGRYYICPNNVDIYCLNSSNIDLIWTAPHVSTGYSYHRNFINLPAIGCVAYYNGASCTAYNIEDGSVVHNWVTNDSIVNVSDRDGDGYPLIITGNGGMALPATNYGEDVLGMTYEFTPELYDAVVNHGVYAFQDYSNEIIYYNHGVHDDNWEQTDDVLTTSCRDYYLDDDVLALLYGFEGGPTLNLIDPDTNESLHEIHITNDSESYYDMRIVGAYDGCLYIIDNPGTLILHEVDIESGNVRDIEVFDGYSPSCENTAFEDGKLYYLFNEGDVRYFGIYDIDSGDTERYELDVEFLTNLQFVPKYIEEMDLIYVSSPQMDYFIDITNGHEINVEIPDDWNETLCVVPDPSNDHVIIADGNRILFVNSSGEVDYSVSTEGKSPLGMDIITNEEDGTSILVAAYATGELGRYDLSTGELLGLSSISSYRDYLTEATFNVDWENNYLYINSFMLTDVVNMDSWVEEAYIVNSFGHHNPTDRFYTTSYSNSEERLVGYYRHYTAQDLVDRAYDILGDNAEVPDYLRARYGL